MKQLLRVRSEEAEGRMMSVGEVFFFFLFFLGGYSEKAKVDY